MMNHFYLFVRVANGRLCKIHSSDILLVEAGPAYTTLVTLKGNFFSETSMSDFEKKLGINFCRVHRSYIVSITHLNYIDRFTVTVASREVPISSTYKKQIRIRYPIY